MQWLKLPRAGVCSLRGNAQGVADMAKYTVLYYAGTTAVSVCLGIALVSVIYPGGGRPLSGANMHGNCHGTPAVTQVRCVLSSLSQLSQQMHCVPLERRGIYSL